MSLDVTLIRKRWISYDAGKTLEVNYETMYDSNITHNLTTMAEKAGIYEALWRPHRLSSDYNKDLDDEIEFEENCTMYAKDIIEELEEGLEDLKLRPAFFEKFNSDNGWGLYENFVPFVEKYLDACKQYPDSIVKVSR